MKSFSLFRTNPKLTTNLIIRVDGDDLYAESFVSSSVLSRERYQGQLINRNASISDVISSFWRNTPASNAFSVNLSEDTNIVYNTPDFQIEDYYFAGVTQKSNEKYQTQFEYLAPIYLENIPDNFLIFRYNGFESPDFYTVIDNSVVVSNIDLMEGKIGNFIKKTQEKIPISPIEVSFDESEYTTWKGFDYVTGEYTEKSKILDSELNRELTLTDGFSILTNGFEDLGIVYPNIINLKFGFDDKALEFKEDFYTINRYYGFYIDKIKAKKVSSFNPTRLKSDLKIIDNIFYQQGKKVDPIYRGYKPERNHWIEYNGDFYAIVETQQGFKILADKNLPEDISEYNQNIITFDDNRIDVSLDISKRYIIEMFGEYHHLIYNGGWLINSDYSFVSVSNIFRKSIGGDVIEIFDMNVTGPQVFTIYEINFYNTKDFDTDIINTDLAKFEYEPKITSQPKLYEQNQSYIYKGEVIQIPVTSEFIATGELFSVPLNGFISKTPMVSKWGIKGSNSNFDYPYTFNNNMDLGEYNLTSDSYSIRPDREKQNLDYFYTFHSDNFYGGLPQSLSIQSEDFNIEEYFTSGKKLKHSILLSGDDTLPCSTVFKGIGVNVFNIESIESQIINDQKVIENISISGSREFSGYDFSIITSTKSHIIENDFQQAPKNDNWAIIRNFDQSQTYSNDIVLYPATNIKTMGQFGFSGFIEDFSIASGDLPLVDYKFPDGTTWGKDNIGPIGTDDGLNLLYMIDNQVRTPYPSNPNRKNLFFNINRSYIKYDNTLSANILSQHQNSGRVIWNYVCFWRDELYFCTRDIISSDRITPDTMVIASDGSVVQYWKKIENYSENKTYNDKDIVLINGDIYIYDINTNTPFLVYSFRPLPMQYKQDDVLKWNDFYIIAKQDAFLNNGINVYINKRDRQILCHIYSNDGLFGELYDVYRDDIYQFYNTYLTATTFIDNINAFPNYSNFLMGVKYYIINEDNSIEMYTKENIEQLPHVLKMYRPTEFNIYNKSLRRDIFDISSVDIRIDKSLRRNNIKTPDEVNYYNGEFIGLEFSRPDNFNFLNSTVSMKRFGGNYDIIFKDIKDNKTAEIVKSKFTKDDILKIKSDEFVSEFIMIGEIGYFIDKIDITKTSWSDGFIKKTIKT